MQVIRERKRIMPSITDRLPGKATGKDSDRGKELGSSPGIVYAVLRSVTAFTDEDTGKIKSGLLNFVIIGSKPLDTDEGKSVNHYQLGSSAIHWINYVVDKKDYVDSALNNYIKLLSSFLGVASGEEFDITADMKSPNFFKKYIGEVFMIRMLSRRVKAEKEKYWVNFAKMHVNFTSSNALAELQKKVSEEAYKQIAANYKSTLALLNAEVEESVNNNDSNLVDDDIPF